MKITSEAEYLAFNGFMALDSMQLYMENYLELVKAARRISKDYDTPNERLPIISQFDIFIRNPNGIVYIFKNPDGAIDAFMLGRLVITESERIVEIIYMWVDIDKAPLLMRPGLGFIEAEAVKLDATKLIMSFRDKEPEVVFQTVYKRVGFTVIGYTMEKSLT